VFEGADGTDRVLRNAWRGSMAVVGADGMPATADAGSVLRPFTRLKLVVRIPPTCDPGRAATALGRALTADPQWTNDTTMLVPIAANILITVNPTAFNGTNPTVSCAGCTFGAGLIDFGTIASDNATHTYGDVVRIDITTTASGAPGWNVYESVATNPTNVSGAPTNELQTRIDGAVSNPVSGGAVTYTTVATVVPTAGNGATMATTTGANAQRNPFSLIDSFLLNVASGDVLGARTPAVTYTFIAN